MPIKFKPVYIITPEIASCLMKIEALKTKIVDSSLPVRLLASWRETTKLFTTHYSNNMIEGNQLNPGQVEAVLIDKKHFPGKDRDEREVKGYYAALARVEEWATRGGQITGNMIQMLHALVMAGGRIKVKASHYRDGQNVIRDSKTRAIVYMPPEAKDVPALMDGLIQWLQANKDLPCPILAGIAHYQFATIHPYYDGNGRTARLLTTLILQLGGYDLQGLYSLEEHYLSQEPALSYARNG